jgi:predicted permease
VPSGDELRREILDAEPMLARLGHTVGGSGRRAPSGAGLPAALSGLAVDVRLGVRRLRNAPAYTVTLILTLAICLAANAVILTLVDRVLLRPLDVPEPDRLVLIANQFPNTGVGGRGEKTAPANYFDRVEGVSSLSAQALFGPVDRVLTLGDRAEQVHGIETTPSLFAMLQVGPALGRVFTPDEGEIGNETSILLSDGFWRERFAADPTVVGSAIRVAGRPYVVVGVMPAGFTFFDPDARFWIPLVFPPSVNNGVANNWYHVGRMAADATIPQVQAEVDAVNAAWFDRQPNLAKVLATTGFHTTVEPFESFLVGEAGRVIYPLWGGAVVVLLIGALNVTNLTLAETHRRRRDLLTRMAIGAGRGRLAVGLLAESMTIAVVAGVLGVALATLVLRVLGTLRLGHLALPSAPGIGWPIATAIAAIALVAGLFVAIASLRHLRTGELAHGLRDSGRAGTGGRRASRLRRVLVTAEVALAFVLLAGAALLLVTVRNLIQADPGYAVDGVVTAGLNLEGSRHPDKASAQQFLDRTLEAIRAVPGVTAAGATTTIPLRTTLRGATSIAISGGSAAQMAVAEDTDGPGVSGIVTPRWVTITAGFFDALETRVLRGRDFEDRDHQTDNPVAIVDATMAESYWPGENPIGKRFFLMGVRNIGRNENTRWLTVVGVVPDLMLEGVTDLDTRVGTFYTTWSEINPRGFPQTYGLVIRTTTDPAAVVRSLRSELARLDPEASLFDVRTLDERRSASLSRQRLALSLASAFGGIALFLSTLGIYGVLSYVVAQRVREFGIRIALGGTSGGILRLVLREGLMLVGVGVAIGLGLAWMLTGAIATQLYGVAPTDPLLLTATAVFLALVALAAMLAPARRAARVDPLIALQNTT